MNADNVFAPGIVRDDGKFYRCKGAFSPSDEVFDHTQFGVFNVTLINSLIRAANIEPVRLPLDEIIYDHCLRNGGVEETRIKSLSRDRLHAPITVVTGDITPDDKQGVFMIDGHHRVVKRWRFGLRYMDAFVCPWSVAKDCRIELEDAGQYIDPRAIFRAGMRRTYFEPPEPRL